MLNEIAQQLASSMPESEQSTPDELVGAPGADSTRHAGVAMAELDSPGS